MPSRPITDLLARERPVISVEFFPPKDDAGGAHIIETAQEIKRTIKPDFVSITYGAGGTTRERTFRYASELKNTCGFEVMPHLTCVGSSRAEILEIVNGYVDAGFSNLMALRGDPPKGEATFQPHPDGLRYAADLVALLRENFGEQLCLGVAGYPEVHPEASGAADDLRHLKAKVDAGGSFVTTQLFYRNRTFLDFATRCRESGIAVPIIPGLMPITSAKAARRFCSDLPSALADALNAAGDSPAKIREVGIDWTYRQISELIAAGFKGVHLYIMNRSGMVIPIMDRLRASGLLA